jgi:two-component sensor histidine kinase
MIDGEGEQKGLSLNQRIMLIVAVALLPLAIISFTQSYRARDHLNELSGERLRASANATAANQRQAFSIANRMLARAVIDRDIDAASPACSANIKRILFAQDVVINLTKSDASGKVLCSGIPFETDISFAGQQWWEVGKTTKNVTISAPIVGEISKRQIFVMMLPQYDASGQYLGAITAAIDASWLQNAMTNLRLSSSSLVSLVDGSGRILMTSQPVKLNRFQIAKNEQHLSTATTADGAVWLYQSSPIFGDGLYVVFAEPRAEVLSIANQFLVQNIILPIGTIIFACFAVWWGLRRHVIFWLEQLILKAKNISTGTHQHNPLAFAKASPEIRGFAKTLDSVASDIEHQKAKLEEAAARSESLAREINHRVKNNLQIILSLLHLQAAKTTNFDARQILQQTLARMGAVSAAQRLTYEDNETADSGTVNMSHLIDALTRQLRGGFDGQAQDIKVACDITAYPASRAIPVVLIIVEAVLNAKSHAFDTTMGQIEITFCKQDDGAILKISDNGNGFDVSQKSGQLGFDLIEALVIQLNAKLSINSAVDQGTRITVFVPDE